ncbi:MAG: type II toxin-antitoxin system Phd/YefM family antitoxin [Candidatus Aminicenantes bacterium]|nr:MAG: type II toxin-antitoxin system Phd/YefM family antitoxin [Candidatus Aminicenantes bacterium]
MDKTIGISELRKDIASRVKEIHEDRSRYIIIQRSKPKAVLMSPEEVETLEIMADKEILNEIKQAKQDIQKGWFKIYEEFYRKQFPDSYK